VLVVDDEQNMQTVMRMVLENAGHEVLIADSGESALVHAQNPNLDVVLTDLRMPGMGGEEFVIRCRKERPDVPVIIVTAHGTIRSAVKSIHDGAADYLTKPFEPEQLEIVVHNAIKLRDILRENTRLKAEVNESRGTKRLVGEGRVAQQLLEEIRRVAPYKTGVLITGESGTGKELVARTIHQRSLRATQPFIPVNCAAIPENLLESELFGHVKGSFTGAVRDKQGLFAAARGGSFFLDEVGEMPPALQVKLLRVLQEREAIPVGATEAIPVDVRIIAATNRDLEEEARRGRFRSDLFYRLNVITIHLPPLRERREDVLLLVESFLQRLAAEHQSDPKALASEALDAVMVYDWPGNVRELENALEHAWVLTRGDIIEPGALPERITKRRKDPLVAERSYANPTLDVIERAYIMYVLQSEGGNKTRAAEVLGIDPSTLYRKLSRYEEQTTPQE